jgi:aminopeptidase N
VWKRSDSEPAQEFVMMAYPAYQVRAETVETTDRWLTGDHNASLRRLVAEGRDGVVRALKARQKDRSTGS